VVGAKVLQSGSCPANFFNEKKGIKGKVSRHEPHRHEPHLIAHPVINYTRFAREARTLPVHGRTPGYLSIVRWSRSGRPDPDFWDLGMVGMGRPSLALAGVGWRVQRLRQGLNSLGI
jgi:hypothetical protein